MTADVVTLYAANFRDPVAALRTLADRIEAGEYGDVGCVAVAVLGDTMEIHGCGPDSEAPSVALLFHAAFMRLSRSVEAHGRDGG